MGVSQKDIADYLGLDRTTVTKILNRDPKYSASEATKEKVFWAAEKLGYDFTIIRRPFKREYGRTQIDAACEIVILLEDGEEFDRGKATARNIGVGGALLTEIVLKKMVLPLQNFTMQVKILDIANMGDMKGECELVRMSDSTEAREPELGVRFVNATHRDRWRIKEYVEARMQEEKEKRSEAADASVS
jgi:transcriptional regulator with XRE-family HTH domain